MKIKLADHVFAVEYGAILVDKTLVTGDFHLGYEHALKEDGIAMPKFQLMEVEKKLQFLVDAYKPERIVLNGDVKHLFQNINPQEWTDVRSMLDFLEQRVSEIVVIRGNHDNYIQTIIKRHKVRFFDEMFSIDGRVAVIHGDKETDVGKHSVIIQGNEHPAMTISTGVGDNQKIPCVLFGKVEGKLLIVHPAFSPLALGVDVLTETKFLSPRIRKANLGRFKIVAVADEELLEFPEIRKIRERAP